MKKIILAFSFLALLAVAPNFGEAASLSELKAQLNALSKQIADMQKAEVVSAINISAAVNKIKVVSPNGGEIFTAGKNMNIILESSGGQEIDLFLYPQNNKIATVIVSSENSASNWQIPNDINGINDVKNYRIRASLYQKFGRIRRLLATDLSDAPFSIVSPTPTPITPTPATPSIKVVSPNGGESLNWSGTNNIIWNYSGLSSVAIALYKNNSFFNWINANVSIPATNNAGASYDWTPSETLSEANVGNNIFKIWLLGYKINGGQIEDYSDAPFSIVSTPQPPTPVTPTPATPSIKVVSPNGGEKFNYGGTATINWTSQNISLTSTIQIIARNYLKDRDTGENYVIARTANDGTETMKLSDVLNGGLLPVGVYKINVAYTDEGNWVHQDWGDDFFFILPSILPRFIEL